MEDNNALLIMQYRQRYIEEASGSRLVFAWLHLSVIQTPSSYAWFSMANVKPIITQ